MKQIKRSAKKLQLEVLEKLSGLITAGLGLVAALAWNNFIQNLFQRIFGTHSDLVAQGGYAVLITVIVVVLTIQIGKVINKVKDEIKVEDDNKTRVSENS